MFTLRKALVLLSTAAFAQELATCDGNTEPDYNDCDAVLAANFPDDTQRFYPPPQGNNCYEFYNGDSLNCAIGVCWTDTTKTAIGIEIKNDYNVVKTDCSRYNAGGTSVSNGNDGYYVTVRFNADYVPQTQKLAVVNTTSEPARQQSRDLVPARQHSRDLLQARADTGYTLVALSRNVETDVEYAITGRLPAGSMHTIENTESMTTGITYSMSVGADLFEIFTASVDISTSQDFTTSNTVGDSINVDCASGQEGIIYWVPLYDVYFGYYTPSGTNEEIHIPLDTAQGRGNYMVRCLG